MGSARNRTQAKAARERTVRERRENKLEKKRLAAAERKKAALSADMQPTNSDAAGRG